MKILNQIIQQSFEVKSVVLKKLGGGWVLGQIVVERKIVRTGCMQLQGSVLIDYALLDGEKYYRLGLDEFRSGSGNRIFLGQHA